MKEQNQISEAAKKAAQRIVNKFRAISPSAVDVLANEIQSALDAASQTPPATTKEKEWKLVDNGDSVIAANGFLQFEFPASCKLILDMMLTRINALEGATQTARGLRSEQTGEAWRDLLPDECPQLGDRFYDPEQRDWHCDELPPDNTKPASWPGWVTNTWQRRINAATPRDQTSEQINRALWTNQDGYIYVDNNGQCGQFVGRAFDEQDAKTIIAAHNASLSAAAQGDL